MSQTVLVILFLILTLLIARRAQTTPDLWDGLFLLLGGANLSLVYFYGIVPTFGLSESSRVSPDRGAIATLVAIGFASVAFLLMLRRVRLPLKRIFTPAFDPNSLPQMTALIFCVYMLAETVLSYILQGGLSGIADNFKGVTVETIGQNASLFVIVAVVGAGFPIQRSWPGVLARLGLRWPTVEELAAAFVLAIGLVFCALMAGILWELTTSTEVIEQQTQVSRLIAGSVETLSFAFIVAMGAAVGEEIAFRGGLQPIFGLWPTAIFFALTHIQYTLTPASILIVIVGLGLGWIRRRYNTTASIMTHFFYNFALLFLGIYGRYLQDVVARR